MNPKGVEAFVREIQSNEGAPPHLVFIQLYAQQTCKNRSDGSKQVLKVTYTFHIDLARCSFANAIKLLLTPNTFRVYVNRVKTDSSHAKQFLREQLFLVKKQLFGNTQRTLGSNTFFISLVNKKFKGKW